MGRFSGKTCRLSIMLSLTFSFFIVEIIFGYLTNSMALIADSFHMLSDVLALLIAFGCMKISRRNATNKNTFGWVRAEVLGALVNAVFLMALCFSICIEALKRIIKPEDIEQPLNILIVGALGLFINIIGIFMFHGHSSVHGHSHARPVPLDLPRSDDEEAYFSQSGRKNMDDDQENELVSNDLGPIVSGAHNISVLLNDQNYEDAQSIDKTPPYSPVQVIAINGDLDSQLKSPSDQNNGSQQKHLLQNSGAKHHTGEVAGHLNMHGVFLHVLGDAFGSVIVVVNALICMYSTNETLVKYSDPCLSLAIALIITMTTLPLLKESAMILLQTVPTHLNVQDMKAKLIKSIDGVIAMHDFHVWRLAGNKIIATAHIRCQSPEDYMKIAEKIKEFFHREGIHSTTIQPEFVEVNIHALMATNICMLECPKRSQCIQSKCCADASATSDSTTTTTTTMTSPQQMELGLQLTLQSPDSAARPVLQVTRTSSTSTSPAVRQAKSAENLSTSGEQ